MTQAEQRIDLAEAYTVQDRFTASLGRTIGYKIAYINPAVQRQLGIPSPLFGRLIEGRVATSPARLDPTRFSNLLVETEFSFRIARSLRVPPRSNSTRSSRPSAP